MKNRLLLLAAFSLSCFQFISCTKEDSQDATDSTPIAASASIDLANELDIQTGTQVSFDKLTARQTGKTLAGTCATAVMDPVTTTFPKTFYVDFGTGCTLNNITRKGKLKITFSGYITENGSTMTIERINYSINGNKLEGKIVYKNITVTAPKWTRTVTDGIFTDTKGNVYQNSGSYTITQNGGASTPTLDDDSFEMTQGTTTITKQNGQTITLTVTQSLIKKYSCDYVSKGKIKVESTILNGTIDYGTGDCDNKATYTQNGIEFPITM
ncbi:hypothetical protein [Flavobacterium gilvum]|uniref:Lipoprotein n=1 Tax=Flavobacterium gilvum TaxID=1492737 RepID=A0AAC9I261_9FLAO|nr:hypothetical protein [Flavobacterium gilvum]AOW08076.1 hypothetical protein EM308_00300 [Flavobacterium gilvum]KFC57865.1 hypothetical protein FEM08_33500 [Flavobacterium gilvum]